MENASANRNKHNNIYGSSKLSKIIFNNKTLLHRGGLSKFFLPDKRPRNDVIIPPTKFLLGGNISDPLNLNSLQDEALASMNAATPKSSPITTPPKVEVIIPPNICDPLHLLDPVDSVEYEKQLISPMKQRRLNKHRNRKKKTRKALDADDGSASDSAVVAGSQAIAGADSGAAQGNGGSDIDAAAYTDDEERAESRVPHNGATAATSSNSTTTATATTTAAGATTQPLLPLPTRAAVSRDLTLDLSGGPSGRGAGRKRKSSESASSGSMNGASSAAKNKLRRMDSMDKIVSPVIPQPGAWKRPQKVLPMGAPRNRNRTASTSINEELISPTDEFKKAADLLDEDGRGEVDVEQADVPATECSNEPSSTVLASSTASLSFKCESVNAAASAKSLPASLSPAATAAAVHNEAKKNQAKYPHGNYVGRYLGVQNLFNFSDVRLTVFLRHPYLFRGKDILDIGCNVGHMTFAVARNLHPKSIIGIDIDRNLIARARRNMSLFVRMPPNAIEELPTGSGDASSSAAIQKQCSRKKRRSRHHRQYERTDVEHSADFFPVSFPICYRPLVDVDGIAERVKSATTSPKPASAPAEGGDKKSILAQKDDITAAEIDPAHMFPKNVFFRTMNFAAADESQLSADSQQYDLIMCLSVTKWIHLNYGDGGLKMTFKRIFNQLRPGGKLILEAQNWASYKKRKKLTVNWRLGCCCGAKIQMFFFRFELTGKYFPKLQKHRIFPERFPRVLAQPGGWLQPQLRVGTAAAREQRLLPAHSGN